MQAANPRPPRILGTDHDTRPLRPPPGPIHVDPVRAVRTCRVVVHLPGLRVVRWRLRLARPLLALACRVGGLGGYAVEVGRE